MTDFEPDVVVSDLEEEFREAVKETMAWVSIVTFKKLVDNIFKYVYDSGNSSNTEYFNGSRYPTGQFLDAWEHTEFMNAFKVYISEVYFNEDLIKPMHSDTDGFWNAHMSLSGKPFKGDGLAEVLNRIEKSVGAYHTDKKRQGRYWDETLEWVEENLDSIIRTKMKSLGFELDQT